jgi:hypothetical protein
MALPPHNKHGAGAAPLANIAINGTFAGIGGSSASPDQLFPPRHDSGSK